VFAGNFRRACYSFVYSKFQKRNPKREGQKFAISRSGGSLLPMYPWGYSYENSRYFLVYTALAWFRVLSRRICQFGAGAPLVGHALKRRSQSFPLDQVLKLASLAVMFHIYLEIRLKKHGPVCSVRGTSPRLWTDVFLNPTHCSPFQEEPSHI